MIQPDNDDARSAKEAKYAKQAGEDLLTRLQVAGISIAVDKATRAALLVFSESDVLAVKDVAMVYKPFEMDLTMEQRRDLALDLETYERLIQRNRRRENK
jgi:hypothetical protein